MNCPVCNITLIMKHRESVEIDYCPKCRGVWLDRGELDKIISKGSHPEHEEMRQNDHDDDRFDNDRRSYPNNRRKRDSFLGDLFDF